MATKSQPSGAKTFETYKPVQMFGGLEPTFFSDRFRLTTLQIFYVTAVLRNRSVTLQNVYVTDCFTLQIFTLHILHVRYFFRYRLFTLQILYVRALLRYIFLRYRFVTSLILALQVFCVLKRIRFQFVR